MQWIPDSAVDFFLTYWPLIGLVLLCALYWDYKVTYGIWKKQGIPGPMPIPYLGVNPFRLYKTGIPSLITECIQKYGNICGIFVGRTPVLLVAEPEFIKQVNVKHFSNFVNRTGGDFRHIPENTMLKSVLLLKDKDWKRVRTTISPVFSAAKMKQMVPLINEGLETLVQKLGDCADRGETVNMAEMFGKFTMESIFRAAFGINAQTQTDPNDKYTTVINKLFEVPYNLQFIFFVAPFLRQLLLMFRRNFLLPIQYLRETAKTMVAKRRETGHPPRHDLLKLMMEAEVKNENGTVVNKLSDQEINGQCVTFLLAGYETTANALTFISYSLAKYPDIQEKVLTEINQHLDEDETPDYDTVNNMEYLDKVLNESLRMYPPVMQTGRVCKEECTIEGICIPKDAVVATTILALHHRPDIWEEPEVFDPERFSIEAKASRHQYAHVPFFLGPRNCVGMRFALVEAKLALIQVLRNFKIVSTSETQLKVNTKAKFVILAEGGIKVKLVKRKPHAE